MKILDNSDKHLLSILPGIISEKINKKAVKIKFIGGEATAEFIKLFCLMVKPLLLKVTSFRKCILKKPISLIF